MNGESARQLKVSGSGWPLLQIILIVLVMAGSVLIGSLAQEMSLRMLIFALALIAGWGCYALFFGISMRSSLPLLAMFFIKPMEITFYLVLAFLIFIGLIEYLRQGELKLLLPYPMATLLLLGFGILSATKINTSIGYTYFLSTILTPLLILMIFNNIHVHRSSLLLWMQAVVYVGMVLGLYGVIVAIRNPLERLGSFWVTAMTINGFYTVAFFFAITLVLYQRDQVKRAINALAALIILLGMLYTYTRIAILAVAFGIFLFMLKLKLMRYLGIIFMLLLPLIIPSSMASRFEMGLEMDLSMVIRFVAWYMASGQIMQHPLTGIGFSVWSTWYSGVIPLPVLYAQHTHNVYLNLMVEMGIIGAGAFFYLIWRIMRNFLRSSKASADPILEYGMWVSLMALLFSCLTDIFIQQYPISILFWVSLGLMLAISKTKEQHEQI